MFGKLKSLFASFCAVSILVFMVSCESSENMISSKNSENMIFLEAENLKTANKSFKVVENIHVSGGRFISYSGSGKDSESEVFKVDFPESKDDYVVWVCSKGIDLGFFSQHGGLKKFKTRSNSWKWHNLGSHNRKNIGASFSVYTLGNDKIKDEGNGIDCIILSRDPDFKPEGVYFGYSKAPETDSEKTASSESLKSLNMTVYPEKTGSRISNFIASANADTAARHLINNPEWNDTMRVFFSGNLLILLQRSKKKVDKDGAWWDFDAIDKFVLTAKKTWGVKAVMMLPAWKLKYVTGKTDNYDSEDLEKGRKCFMQLVERYAKSGPLHIEYWAISDEWTAGGYWKKNRRKFCEYYAYLLRELKQFNPDVKAGGPVDCWPDKDEIAELMRHCPELDFIAWNLFATGRADIPLARLFAVTANFSDNINICKDLGREILKRDIPVMVSSYGPNYHAWSPPDYKLAAPVAGVWNALALARMTNAGCFCAANYNTRASDCGLFGSNDSFAIKSGFSKPGNMNIRPYAFIQLFFKENMAGASLCDLAYSGDNAKFCAVAAKAEDNALAIVMVNYSETPRKVDMRITPFNGGTASRFDLPVKYIYCDSQNMTKGNGLFFSTDGKGSFYMPPYSVYCLKIKSGKESSL
jgi:hypothetical protein